VLNISIEDFFASSAGKSFDLVVASDTLSNFYDARKFLEQTTNVCAPNAVLGIAF
jgi:ubiquinone/menaquinone biosynthesis C-methylase UbiE